MILLSHAKSSSLSKRTGRGVIWMPYLVQMLLSTYLADLSKAEFWVQLFQQIPWRTSLSHAEDCGPDDIKFRQRTAILARSIVKLVQENILEWNVMFQMQVISDCFGALQFKFMRYLIMQVSFHFLSRRVQCLQRSTLQVWPPPTMILMGTRFTKNLA